MKERVRRLVTHPAALLSVAALIGLATGVGAFTFVYAKGASYLTNDPAACANCHIMRSQYDGWQRGSHRAAAVCNDCHVPHNLVGKYYVKSRNGFWHSYWFTLGGFHEPIAITPASLRVTERRCRECHGALVRHIDGVYPPPDRRPCVTCHAEVGHRR